MKLTRLLEEVVLNGSGLLSRFDRLLDLAERAVLILERHHTIGPTPSLPPIRKPLVGDYAQEPVTPALKGKRR